MIDPRDKVPPETTLSRRRLLIGSAQLTAGAATLFRAGVAVAAISPSAAEPPGLTDEIAGHWTTF